MDGANWDDGRGIVELTAVDQSARLSIAVARGFNAFRWDVDQAGETIPILWSEPAFPDRSARATGSGIPLLFPFGGRIAGRRYEWRGRTYELPEGDGRGNAIHGAVFDRPWHIVECSGDRVTARFHAGADWPQWESQWPADFRIDCSYRLQPRALVVAFDIENRSHAPLPCGLGIHPYFAVDLDREPVRLDLPATRRWELQGLVPTGEFSPWDNPPAGMPLKDVVLDDVVSDWSDSGGDGTQRVTLRRGPSHPDVALSFDASDFPFCVVYTAPTRRAVCIEPYSMLPNAFELRERGIETGMWLIEPGGGRSTEIRIELA